MALSVVGDNDQIIIENSISLKKFPPQLRKIGKFLLESEKPITLEAACKALEVNYDSVRTMIWKSKKKGNDFQRFIDEQSSIILHNNKIGVYKALIGGAVSPAPQSTSDRKLYFQLTGDLKETANVNVNNLTIGINIQGIGPQDLDRSKGLIDTVPIIPKKP